MFLLRFLIKIDLTLKFEIPIHFITSIVSHILKVAEMILKFFIFLLFKKNFVAGKIVCEEDQPCDDILCEELRLKFHNH